MGHNPVSVDCLAFGQPDLATVDALLHLRLMLKRAGEDLVLDNSGPRLRELISLLGVREVLECAPSVEAGREAEKRK
jgi:hypothetical protein